MKVPVRYFMFCLKRNFLSLKFILLFVSCTLTVFVLTKLSHVGNEIVQMNPFVNVDKSRTTTPRPGVYLNPERLKQIMINKKNNNLMAKKNKTNLKMKWWEEKIKRLNKMRAKLEVRHVEVNQTVVPNYNVHVFYYAWFENMDVDGNWQHWNHEYLKNWKKNDKKIYPTGRHVPPDDIGSNFYPKLGCYSSRNPDVVDHHLKEIRDAGIGVLIVSWYPPGMSDGSSRSPDTVFLQLLNAAHKHRLKLAPHIEPYEGRTPSNLLEHVKYFASPHRFAFELFCHKIEKPNKVRFKRSPVISGAYGNHPALYKMKRRKRELVVYYVYDSYRTPASSWRELLADNGNITLRGSPQDGIFLGLMVDVKDKQEIKRARFDGFYTYFASNGFTYGSSWKNWKTLAVFAHRQDLIFIPSVGPGYVDTRIRPWNSANTRHRQHGKYYEVGWRTALGAGANFVSITSFNEWHEGTQIEPAVPKSIQDFVYLDYEPEGPDFYMNLTKFWVYEFSKKNTNVSIFT